MSGINIANAVKYIFGDMLAIAAWVNNDYNPEAAEMDSTFTIPRLLPFEAKDWTRAGGVTIQPISEDGIPVIFTEADIKDVSIEMNLLDTEITKKKFKEIMSRIVSAQSEAINDKAWDVEIYKQMPSFMKISSTPDQKDLVKLATRFAMKGIEKTNGSRGLFLSPVSWGEFAGLDVFKDASKSGSTRTLRDNSLGVVSSFETYEDCQGPYHEAGTISAETSVKAAGTAGETTITISDGGNAKTIKAGDLFQVDEIGQFCAQADTETTSGGAATVTVDRKLPSTFSATDTTFCKSHYVSYALHKNSITLASRVLKKYESIESYIVNSGDIGVALRMAFFAASQHEKNESASVDSWTKYVVTIPEACIRVVHETQLWV